MTSIRNQSSRYSFCFVLIFTISLVMIFEKGESEAYGTHEFFDGKVFEMMDVSWDIVQDYTCGNGPSPIVTYDAECYFLIESESTQIVLLKNPFGYGAYSSINDFFDNSGEPNYQRIIRGGENQCDVAEFSRDGYECWGFSYDNGKFRSGHINGNSAYSADFSYMWKPSMHKNERGYPGHTGATERTTIVRFSSGVSDVMNFIMLQWGGVMDVLVWKTCGIK